MKKDIIKNLIKFFGIFHIPIRVAKYFFDMPAYFLRGNTPICISTGCSETKTCGVDLLIEKNPERAIRLRFITCRAFSPSNKTMIYTGLRFTSPCAITFSSFQDYIDDEHKSHYGTIRILPLWKWLLE